MLPPKVQLNTPLQPELDRTPWPRVPLAQCELPPLQGANILIDQKGQVILADLGVTAQMRTDFRIDRLAAQPGTRAYLERTTFAGTPCWMAPEVMEEDVG